MLPPERTAAAGTFQRKRPAAGAAGYTGPMEDAHSIPKWERALAGLSQAERAEVCGRLRIATHPPHRLLLRQGDPSHELLIVQRGRVRLYLITAEGGEFTLSVLGPGRILGLAACIARKPAILSVETVDDGVEIARLAAPDLFQCLDRMPTLSRNVMELLATLAIEHIQRTAPLALDSAALRLAELLLQHAEDDQARTGGAVVRGLRHEDLAKMVGATRTWVAMTLAGMERRGLVRKGRGVVGIPERRRLELFVAAQRR